MIFSKSRPVKIVLVGTGGTGGYIVPQLYRLLYALDRPIRVILCDGDLVEEKNLGRQNFIEADLGKNKAMVLAERYSNAFGIETSYIPQYVEDEEMLEELLEPLQYPQNRYVMCECRYRWHYPGCCEQTLRSIVSHGGSIPLVGSDERRCGKAPYPPRSKAGRWF